MVTQVISLKDKQKELAFKQLFPIRYMSEEFLCATTSKGKTLVIDLSEQWLFPNGICLKKRKMMLGDVKELYYYKDIHHENETNRKFILDGLTGQEQEKIYLDSFVPKKRR